MTVSSAPHTVGRRPGAILARRRRGFAALTAGLALAGVLGTVQAAHAAPPASTTGSTATTATRPIAAQAEPSSAMLAQSWFWIGRWNVVFTEYGGPSTHGTTADEFVYAYCQQDGIWGWQTYTWVPSLGVTGWIRNGDLTGFTNPIPGLDVC